MALPSLLRLRAGARPPSPPPDAPRPDRRAAAQAFIFITIVLDAMAIGMVLPVLPRLIQALGGGKPAQVAAVFGLFATIFAVMQFVVSPIQGALSDRFGRRPIVLTSNFGLGLDYVLMALAPNLGWLFAGRVISGGAAGSITAAFAYLADVTPPERRASSFSLMFAANSFGFALGPALGGLIGEANPRAPFWIAAALSLANGLYGLFILPESLAPENRAPVNWRELNPLGALSGLTRTYPLLIAMLAASFLFSLVWQGLNPIFPIYGVDRFGWRPLQIGLMIAAFGFTNMLMQLFLVTPIVARLGERATAMGGFVVQVVSFVVMGAAGSGVMFVLAIPLMCLGGVSGPAWSAIASQSVGPSEQGRLSGATNSLNSIAGMVGPAMFTAIFAAVIAGGTDRWQAGAPFFTAALIAVMASAAAGWAMRRRA
jgi:DHA1 family tetracycline resistance protein-like MFS transporter